MDFVEIFLKQIQALGPFIYLFIFIVAAVESFVLTGVFLPGTLFIVLMGFLSAQGVLNIYAISLITTLGVILGDLLGFYFGQNQGKWFLNKMHKLFKMDYVGAGEKFFESHGNKSVFIGRFVAVIRPFIPFVAGLLNMNFGKFLFSSILSAFVWTSLYLFLGYFFGAAFHAIAVWSGRVGMGLLAVIAAYFIFSYLRNSFKKKQIKNLDL